MDKTAIYFVSALALGIGAFTLYKVKYDDWVVIPEARKTLQSKFRDPDSAQFRNERITKTHVYCGEVNAKNGMGGYVGFRKFVSHGAGSYVEGIGPINDPSNQEFLDRLDKEIAIMKRHNQMRKDIPDLEMPSKSQITEMASKEMFEDKWKEACDG